MSSADSNLPPSEPPRNEAEYLQQEAQLSREALTRLRGEIVQSLERTADLEAWATRYPWPTLGTAAAAGIGAGWALGKAIRGKPAATESPAGGPAQPTAGPQAAPQPAHPAARMVSGLGTIVGAFASAATVAASQAVAQVVKESLHDALRPEDPGAPPADGDADTDDYGDDTAPS